MSRSRVLWGIAPNSMAFPGAGRAVARDDRLRHRRPSIALRHLRRGVPVGRCGVATRSKNMRERDARVIAAAWRLIAREGLHALTVKALAEEAGVPPSSMLYTLPNHAVVRERALEAIAPAIRKRISALPPEPDDGPERAGAARGSAAAGCRAPCRGFRHAGAQRQRAHGARPAADLAGGRWDDPRRVRPGSPRPGHQRGRRRP